MLDRVTIEQLTANAGEGPILVAYSGGGDSTALLHILRDALGASRLRAAIVDHALREGSAADAQRASRVTETLGVEAHVLTLSWPSGTNQSQQSAREARYCALYDYARAHGAQLIAAGHNADDQAETVLMRAAAGSTWRGLAAMATLAPAPFWPEGRGLALVRPLLSTRREALRDYLRERGATWIEDPANANPTYERVRIRARLAAMEASGFDPMRLTRLAESLRRHVAIIERDASSLIDRSAAFEDAAARIDLQTWIAAPAEVRHRALAVVLAAVAGARADPPSSSVVDIEARMTEPAFTGATFAGVQLTPRSGEIWLARDRGALSGRADGAQAIAPLPLPARVETVWDGRLAITAREPGWSVVADGAAPMLQNASGANQRSGAANFARWLLRERVAHALGQRVNRAKPL